MVMAADFDLPSPSVVDAIFMLDPDDGIIVLAVVVAVVVVAAACFVFLSR